MSRSLTEPTESELDVVRRAQKEMMGISFSSSALTREPVTEFTLSGREVPPSIAWLHSVVERGLGDSYNYTDREFVVEIRPADWIREGSLRNVRTVVLKYAGKEG